jgi:hypothetical protein
MSEIDPGSVAVELPADDQADEIAARALADCDLDAVANYLEKLVLRTIKYREIGIIHASITVHTLIDMLRDGRLVAKRDKGKPRDRHKITRDLAIGSRIHARAESHGLKYAIHAAKKEHGIARSKAFECLEGYRERFLKE